MFVDEVEFDVVGLTLFGCEGLLELA